MQPNLPTQALQISDIRSPHIAKKRMAFAILSFASFDFLLQIPEQIRVKELMHGDIAPLADPLQRMQSHGMIPLTHDIAQCSVTDSCLSGKPAKIQIPFRTKFLDPSMYGCF